MEFQYLLAALGFLATIAAIFADLFPKAKVVIAVLAFFVACGVFIGDAAVITAEAVSIKESRCDRENDVVIGLMSVKERVRLGVAEDMPRVDAREIGAQIRAQSIPNNLDNFEYQRRLHIALNNGLLSEHMGQLSSFEKYIRDRALALENMGSYGCKLEWIEPPAGRFACRCSLLGTVNY